MKTQQQLLKELTECLENAGIEYMLTGSIGSSFIYLLNPLLTESYEHIAAIEIKNQNFC